MLKSKELRAKAWNSLKGKYWLAFAVVLIVSIVDSVGNGFLNLMQNITELVEMVDPAEMDSTMELGAAVLSTAASAIGVVGVLVSIFLTNAATVGCTHYFIKNTDSKPSFADAFYGFKVKYFRNIGTLLLVNIKTVLWSLLFVIPGIIKTYSYAMAPFIMAEHPEMNANECITMSKEIMHGHKMELFFLELSFIGWIFLSIFTLGIGNVFLTPYITAARAAFYRDIMD